MGMHSNLSILISGNVSVELSTSNTCSSDNLNIDSNDYIYPFNDPTLCNADMISLRGGCESNSFGIELVLEANKLFSKPAFT